MLGGVLHGAGEQQDLLLAGSGPGGDVAHGHRACGQRSGLVQDDSAYPARRLQRLRALHQDSQLGAASHPGKQRGRGRQAQRAGTRHHQHSDSSAPGGGPRQSGAQPEAECRGGEADHAGHEDSGDPVGQALRGGLGALRPGDKPGDLREQRIRADPGGADHQAATHVDRRAGHVIAGQDLGRR